MEDHGAGEQQEQGTRERSPHGAVDVGPTALQREYRTVLDAAKQHTQVIVDSDGTTLVA